MKKLYKSLPAILFSGFLLTMFVLFIVLPKKDFSVTEKKPLAEAPAFTWDRLLSGEFGKEFKTFLEDQTPGRNLWVGISAYYNYLIGNNGSNGVYKCADGYLINDPVDEASEDFRLSDNISYIDECAAHTSVPTTVLIAPSTGYICADKLPLVHLSYQDDRYFEQIQDALQHADFVDVREAFKQEYADGHQMYYKTDHHWTAYGAFTAYRALAASLGYTPLSQSDYTITAYNGFHGTTFNSSAFWLNETDSVEIWDNKANDGSIHVAITDGGAVTEQDDMFYEEHLVEDDMYPVYLDGNHPYTVITNENADSDEKLLVVKDSFAHSLVPFLADHYAEITMIDMRYYRMEHVPDLAQELGVDRVLFIYSLDNLATDDAIAFIE